MTKVKCYVSVQVTYLLDNNDNNNSSSNNDNNNDISNHDSK